MITCTCCGCEFAVDGFYTEDGQPIMPCKICRCDQASIYYYENAEVIREQRRKRYYANLEASREKDRNRKRQQRIQTPAQISVL